jgi:hypothetical protein
MLGRTVIAASLALAALPLMAAGRPASAATASRAAAAPPGIRIWTSHGDTYRRGELARVYFRTESDAYVTIFRVDTDGRVRILFPRDPYDPNLAHGGETYTVGNVDDQDAFMVDDYPGVGYVFAVASQDPFIYDAFTASEHWSLQQVGGLADGRIHGDPYGSLQELAQHIMPDGYADYDTHLLPYYVEQRYQYPRFLCYDCHSYVPFAYWNPYSHFCSRFSLFVYYDPFYFYPSYWYPSRYYRGTNVVYVRPRAWGQYVFGNARGGAPGIVYRDRRGTGLQAPAERGIRGADIGGVGSVPAPGGRRVVESGAQGAPGRRDPAMNGGQPDRREPGMNGGQPGRREPGVNGGQPDRREPGMNGGQPGRRGVGSSEVVQGTPGRQPPVRQYIVDEATGRRREVETPPSALGSGAAPRATAPQGRSPQDIGSEARPSRGVYIDPGTRAEPKPRQPQQGAQPAPAAGRYIPSQRSAPESRGYAPPSEGGRNYAPPSSQGGRNYAPPSSQGGRSYAPPSRAPGGPPRVEPRGTPRAEPRAAPQGQSRPAPRAKAPTLIRRRP